MPLTVILLALVLFYRLQVEVNTEFIEIRFGPGLIQKKLPLAEVESCKIVRNRWWYGWGIRWIGKGKWLYNISGLNAVELCMKNKEIYRIGTDEPESLHEFIQGKVSRAIA